MTSVKNFREEKESGKGRKVKKIKEGKFKLGPTQYPLKGEEKTMSF